MHFQDMLFVEIISWLEVLYLASLAQEALPTVARVTASVPVLLALSS